MIPCIRFDDFSPACRCLFSCIDIRVFFFSFSHVMMNPSGWWRFRFGHYLATKRSTPRPRIWIRNISVFCSGQHVLERAGTSDLAQSGVSFSFLNFPAWVDWQAMEGRFDLRLDGLTYFTLLMAPCEEDCPVV
ncbi:hypothetical protein VTL71DRAFT_8749 [Oculimacula yallundae]|uniref:PilZ domain-containing protein n=1 Tax=Oculimacula yallundae TaxID=86028 RepID=A0ABR4CYH9_9HELO